MTAFVPRVGQKVRLSDAGYDDLHLRSAEAIRQSTNMTITRVENINAGTNWAPIWVIKVDQPKINKFLLYSDMVEPL